MIVERSNKLVELRGLEPLTPTSCRPWRRRPPTAWPRRFGPNVPDCHRLRFGATRWVRADGSVRLARPKCAYRQLEPSKAKDIRGDVPHLLTDTLLSLAPRASILAVRR